MNYKVVLGIAGVLIGVGIIYFINRDKTSKGADMNSDYDDAKETVNIINHTEVAESEYSTKINDVKVELAEKMSERHLEAEKIVRESVGNIFGDVEVSKTKNEAAKKKMFDDLENI